MDTIGHDWWAKRRPTYNVFLISAGAAAFACFAIVGETFCFADPDYEMTAFTIAFQVISYAALVVVANVLYGLGPLVERMFKPQDLALYRQCAFGLGTALSVVLPFLAPVSLLIKCDLFRGG
jgi:hypothetical protein